MNFPSFDIIVSAILLLYHPLPFFLGYPHLTYALVVMTRLFLNRINEETGLEEERSAEDEYEEDKEEAIISIKIEVRQRRSNYLCQN